MNCGRDQMRRFVASKKCWGAGEQQVVAIGMALSLRSSRSTRDMIERYVAEQHQAEAPAAHQCAFVNASPAALRSVSRICFAFDHDRGVPYES
jgi:hypothetical protein